MAFDGAGVFLRLRSWIADATAGVKIRADFHDDEDNNFAAGLSQCIVKDGQTTITQNIPFNSKRVTALADPVDAQDAATKAYADTKVAKVGAGTITGDLTVTGNTTISGNLDVGGTASATGYKTRKGLPGPYGGNFFNFDWTGNLEAWVDNTNLGALATQVYANTSANNSAAGKVNRSGDTMTGNLQVNGEIGSSSNIYRFGAIGTSPGYLQWNGGGTYTLGSGGTVWHTGNFNPASFGTVSNGRLALAADQYSVNAFGITEPFNGAVMTGFGFVSLAAFARFRYMQLYTTGWFTCAYA